MSDIRFYHLTRRLPEQALPDLAGRALGKGHKVLVRAATAEETARLNDMLWTYDPESFLAHGTAQDPLPERQPVFLTHGNDNPAQADVLMLMPGADPVGAESFAMCCLLLNGHDEAGITQARAWWKDWKESGHTLTYWQQSDAGKWEQKA